MIRLLLIVDFYRSDKTSQVMSYQMVNNNRYNLMVVMVNGRKPTV